MISIIVPIYNSERYLSRSLDSVLSQTIMDWELILVNDGSTDNSSEICSKYKAICPKIKYIEQPNLGVSAARNRGLSLATGEYIAFLDSDDAFSPSFCERMLSVMKENGSDLVICGAVESDGKTWAPNMDIQYDDMVLFGKDYLTWRKTYLLGPPWNKLYKRGIITNQFRSDVFHSEDLLFNLHYITNCASLSFIRDTLVYHDKTNPTSLTRSINVNIPNNSDKVFAEESSMCDKMGWIFPKFNYITGFIYNFQSALLNKGIPVTDRIKLMSNYGRTTFLKRLSPYGSGVSSYVFLKFIVFKLICAAVAIATPQTSHDNHRYI